MPVPSEGISADVEGAVLAARVYGELLELDPTSIGVRWMLNLSHMMAGTYPAEVPVAWRIPPEVFDSEYQIGRFQEVAGVLDVNDVPMLKNAV